MLCKMICIIRVWFIRGNGTSSKSTFCKEFLFELLSSVLLLFSNSFKRSEPKNSVNPTLNFFWNPIAVQRRGTTSNSWNVIYSFSLERIEVFFINMDSCMFAFKYIDLNIWIQILTSTELLYFRGLPLLLFQPKKLLICNCSSGARYWRFFSVCRDPWITVVNWDYTEIVRNLCIHRLLF